MVARTGCPLRAEQVPTGHREAGIGEVPEPELLDALLDPGIFRARLADAGKVTLDVGHEHRHADGAEALGHHLQCHGLAGAGGPGDQSVPVRHLRQKADRGFAFGDQEWFRHVRNPM